MVAAPELVRLGPNCSELVEVAPELAGFARIRQSLRTWPTSPEIGRDGPKLPEIATDLLDVAGNVLSWLQIWSSLAKVVQIWPKCQNRLCRGQNLTDERGKSPVKIWVTSRMLTSEKCSRRHDWANLQIQARGQSCTRLRRRIRGRVQSPLDQSSTGEEN